ncbi:MAG TPA: CvpA family protein, partial [Gammaproteobacteria bacterium]|nr:CvpA family protein [Gammaproteobacteria bacterium]
MEWKLAWWLRAERRMTSVDYVILVLALLSVLIGVWRGFTTEALSLLTLLAAIGLAWLFAGSVEPHLGDWASAGEVRIWAARLIIFVVVLALGGLAQWLARKLIRHTGLSSVDRTLGAIFGFLRAAVVLGLVVLVLQFTELDQESWWQDARLRPYAERAADAVKYYAELGTRYLEDAPLPQSARAPAAEGEAS